MRYLECRPILCGDSLWMYNPIRILQEQNPGEEIAVVAREYPEGNSSIFHFMRDFLVGCENIKIITDPGQNKTIQMAGGPSHYMGPDIILPLRKPLEPIVDNVPYLCFHPESRAHNKRKPAFKNMICNGRGYSLGVGNEWVVMGTEAWHDRSFSDVARLVYNAVGTVGIFSSICLLSSLLGKRTVVTSYEGGGLGTTEHIGYYHSRCIQTDSGDHYEIMRLAEAHFGQQFFGGGQWR